MFLSSSSRNKWGTPEFWQRICPGLTITDNGIRQVNGPRSTATSVPTEVFEQRRNGLIEIGFAQIDETLMESQAIQKLLQGIKDLQQESTKDSAVKYPASFILLFDETWELARTSRDILKQSTHKSNDFNYDNLAWYIEGGGFSPHRDRQPENVPESFHPDGEAKFVTHWIALSDAQPENSCLYVIPKYQDPGYIKGDDGPAAEDPLRRALSNKTAFQHIRALPRKPGQSLIFTHRIIHWGSARSEDSKLPPRVALSFVCSDSTYEKPYIDPKYFSSDKNPPFRIRLLLVCAQLLIYYQRFDLPKATIKACYDFCKENENELEETYRHKVFLEFVKAMKEAKGEAGDENEVTEKPKNETKGIDDEDEDADEDEAMMEEMLNAEEQGYGEFEDDFDDTNDDDDKEENFATAEGSDEDPEDEGVSLFGRPAGSDPSSKRKKPNS